MHVPWTIEQVTFVTDFRVLQLTSYDLIVGMDWLEQFSPMQVHWLQKWMMIPYQRQWILLRGLNADIPNMMLLHICQVADHSVANATSASTEQQSVGLSYPLEIQELLDHYPSILDPPTELPPSRSCNHTIPLTLGAQPVFIRPYQYPPGLKDEIEKQVNEMLSQASLNQAPAHFLLSCSWPRRKTGHIGSVWIFTSLMLSLQSLNFQSLFSMSLWMNLALLAGFPHWISVLVFIRYYCSLEKKIRQHFKLIAANMNSMSWPLV